MSLAQDKAADPDALDFTARLDTILVTGLGDAPFSALRSRDLNGDSYDEIFLNYAWSPNYSKLHFGGETLIKDSSGPTYQATASLLADIDGDGIQDMISPYSIWSAWHRGHRMFPYFDSAATGLFTHPGFSNEFPIANYDLNGDKVDDLLSIIDFKLILRAGGSYLDTMHEVELYDSIDLPDFQGITYWSHGDLGKTGVHYFIIGSVSSGQSRVGCLRLAYPLAQSEFFWIQNTAEDGTDGIAVTSIYVTDITGDGIADLLLSDGSYIYIFKGGDDFGSYRLTKTHAYYRIPSPRVLYPEQWLDLTGFGGHMRAAGDLSGSGTSYLIADGNFGSSTEYQFIYAGGKALDSLYDGILQVPSQISYVLDTLQHYGSSAHGALTLVFGDLGNFTDNDMANVLYRDAELLPHKPNPNLRVGSIDAAAGSISVVPSIADRSIHITTTSGDRVRRGLLQIHDLLGALVESRNIWVSPESETEFVDLSHFTTGTYIATVLPEGGAPISTKFIVQHQGGLNRRLPYTADVPFLPW